MMVPTACARISSGPRDRTHGNRIANVPATVVAGLHGPRCLRFLTSFPLTANGKTTSALRSPTAPARCWIRFVVPRAGEENLKAIWCDALNLDRVGVHDNFFDLGHHRYWPRAACFAELGRLSWRMFQFATIRAIAGALGRRLRARQRASSPGRE